MLGFAVRALAFVEEAAGDDLVRKAEGSGRARAVDKRAERGAFSFQEGSCACGAGTSGRQPSVGVKTAQGKHAESKKEEPAAAPRRCSKGIRLRWLGRRVGGGDR